MKSIVALIGLVLCMETTAQDRALLPPPPPLRNPMLVPEKIVTAPPSLGVAGIPAAEVETPGWILRRSEHADATL